MAYGSRGRTEHGLVWTVIFGILGVLIVYVAYSFWPHAVSSTQVTIGAKVFHADVADTDQRREHGLKGIDALPEDRALLMKYPEESIWSVTTEGLNFSVDIVWLTSDKRVVFVAKNAKPTGKNVYRPTGKSRYVLQLPTGSITRYNITPGKVVEFEE